MLATSTAGSTGCATCEDPHSTPLEHEIATFFNGKCRACHDSQELHCKSATSNALLDNGIECHMPSFSAADVPHTSQTDHRILRTPKKKVITKDGAAVEFTVFRADSGTMLAEELDRAQAIQLVRTAEATKKAIFAVDAIPILERWTRKTQSIFLPWRLL